MDKPATGQISETIGLLGDNLRPTGEKGLDKLVTLLDQPAKWDPQSTTSERMLKES